jgi:hypothetical protein
LSLIVGHAMMSTDPSIVSELSRMRINERANRVQGS